MGHHFATKHKVLQEQYGFRRSGEAAFFVAQPEWLTTREAGSCSWTLRKAEAPVQSRQALEGLKVMALSAIAGKTDRVSRD
ncbi:hypothetical protein AC739_07265 [Planococcus glaciei]|uniref:hypothetical protein n=1 Tax=Planococcus glaciei TaxID=459472 RepID=UPI00069D7876|nr:hypothetical protein [Planococcus glaciei]KOF10780.1 hypothetical protein AC739_07265 [Planococcus glaciei]MBX0316567.1 hypothetical protein [Planococcus glaciei]